MFFCNNQVMYKHDYEQHNGMFLLLLQQPPLSLICLATEIKNSVLRTTRIILWSVTFACFLTSDSPSWANEKKCVCIKYRKFYRSNCYICYFKKKNCLILKDTTAHLFGENRLNCYRTVSTVVTITARKSVTQSFKSTWNGRLSNGLWTLSFLHLSSGGTIDPKHFITCKHSSIKCV